jgi:hypothetical protein
MITDVNLRDYVAMEALHPRRELPRHFSFTYEQANASSISSIDDITSSMMVTYYARIDGLGYTLGQQTPYQYHIFASNEPATRRSYKQPNAHPMQLSQTDWPHVYPKNIGIIPMRVYNRFELMPRQRTAALTFEEPPAWVDPNPDDSDDDTEARIRALLIKGYIHYPHSEALSIVIINSVRASNPKDRNLGAAEKSLAAAAELDEHYAGAKAGRAGAGAETPVIETCRCAGGCDDETMPGEDLCARCYTIEGCCALDFPDEDQDEAFLYVVPAPLDGPVAGSNRPSGSKDPLGTIVAAARSSRNPSPSYVENPTSRSK